MPIQLFTLLDPTVKPVHSIHFVGMSQELAKEGDKRIQLPSPRILIIREEKNGVLLYRFTVEGYFGGDTWHRTVDDAKHQALYEYGEAIGEWKIIPSEVEANDVLRYVQDQLP